MKITDDFEDYYYALKDSSLAKLRTELLYTYGTPESLKLILDEKDWLYRKVIAIPMALYTGVVQTVYHLAMAALGSTKINLYRAGRDLNEALGWLVTLGDEECGAYFIQQALFHKACYDEFEGAKSTPMPQGSGISLKAFRGKDKVGRQNVIGEFELEEVINGIKDFYHKLECADSNLLEKVYLSDLLNIETSKAKYAFMSKEEFSKLTLRNLQNVSPDVLELIKERVKKEKIDEIFDEEGNALDIPLVQFHCRPVDQLIASNLPDYAFGFFSDEQIRQGDFSNITARQLISLITDGWNVKRRLQLIRPEQISALLPRIPEQFLYNLSQEQIKSLDLATLDNKQLHFMLMGQKDLAFLPVATVQRILLKLYRADLRRLSDQQIQEIDFGQVALNIVLVDNLFGLTTEEEIQWRPYRFPEYVWRNIVYPSMEGQIKEDKRRFALLSPEQVELISPFLSEYGRFLAEKT